MPTRQEMIAEMQAAAGQPSQALSRAQMIAEMEGSGAPGNSTPPPEGFGAKLARYANVAPGTSRAGWQDMLEQALGMDPSPATPKDPQARLDLALSGKYPDSREIYQLDKRLPNPMPAITAGFGAAKGGTPFTPEAGGNPLAAGAGLALDMVQDPSAVVISPVMKALGLVGSEGATLLRNAARVSPEEAQAFSAATKSGLGDKARAAANKIADLIDLKPTAQEAANPISTGLKSAGKKIYSTGVAPLDAAAIRGQPLPSDILWDNNTFVTGQNASSKVRDVIDQALDRNVETFTKAGSRANETISKLAKVQGPLTAEEQVALDQLLTKAQKDLRVQPADTTQYLKQRLAGLSGSREAAPAINYGQGRIDQEMLAGPQPIDKAIQEAKLLRQGARAAYGEGTSPLVPKMKQDLVRGLNDGISKVIDNIPDAGPEVKDAVRKNNAIAGAMINAEPAAGAMNKGPLITPSDVAIPGGLWALGLKGAALPYLALRKGSQALVGPGGRSAIGLALKGLGSVPGADTALRQAYIHEKSPWTLLPAQEGN